MLVGELTCGRCPMPTDRYATILADPPWRYDDTGSNGAVEAQYPTMPWQDIAALPVADHATDNAHLYLWVTNPFLDEGFDVMRRWGFAYKTTITWLKTQPGHWLRPYVGLGRYFRGATEHILFGVRGRLPLLVKDQPNWIVGSIGAHSQKPDESYRLIERCSPGPRLELFARRARPGWDVLGNGIDGRDIREALADKSAT